MFTLGYRFRPWNDPKAIADGPAILEYIRETSKEFGLDKKIRYNHRVVKAVWSTDEALWKITAKVDEEKVYFTCNFLYFCTGYYDYEKRLHARFCRNERFSRANRPFRRNGLMTSNMKTSASLSSGSGATAVTLVPALAEKAAHVTMLQRSPTYVVSRPAKDKIANFLRGVLPPRAAYAMTRWKNVLLGIFFLRRFAQASRP